MSMKPLIQGVGSVAWFGRSTDTIPNGGVNDELYLADLGKVYKGLGTGTGMASWIECTNSAYMPLMTLAAVALSGSYGDLSNVPSAFPPAVHGHAISDVTGLVAALAGKANTTHTHAAADIVSGTLDQARIPALAISKTTGLQAALDGKLTIPAGTTAQYVRGDASLANFPAIPSLTIGPPVARTVALATAYQATTNTKPAIVTVNLTSSATISISGGTVNAADIVIGATNAVASGTGAIVNKYANSNTGTLNIGLNLSTVAGVPCVFFLPIGYWWAVRQTSGTVTISSAFDQQVG